MANIVKLGGGAYSAANGFLDPGASQWHRQRGLFMVVEARKTPLSMLGTSLCYGKGKAGLCLVMLRGL